MGHTDEFKRVNGPLKRAQAWALIIGAMGTATAAIYGAAKPTGQEARAVYHAQSSNIQELQTHVTNLFKAQQQCIQKASQVRAELESVKTYVLGYLLGMNSPRARRGVSERTLKSLIESRARDQNEAERLPNMVQKTVPRLKKPKNYRDIVDE